MAWSAAVPNWMPPAAFVAVGNVSLLVGAVLPRPRATFPLESSLKTDEESLALPAFTCALERAWTANVAELSNRTDPLLEPAISATALSPWSSRTSVGPLTVLMV